MQAVIDKPQSQARRKLHVGLHFEFSLRPDSITEAEAESDRLERAYRLQQQQQRVSAERDTVLRRLKLGY